MATHPSFLAWRFPCTESGGLQSMGSQRVRHDLGTKQQQHCPVHQRHLIAIFLGRVNNLYACCGPENQNGMAELDV